MTNEGKQADEILVLQSILDREFRRLDDHQYEITIEFELLTSITIRLNVQTCTIQHLPPFTLIIHYHEEYPNAKPPSFILSCIYFSKNRLKKLCQKLDNYPFQNEVCIYDWIDVIKHEISHEFILDTSHFEQENDPRALNGYSIETAADVFQYLIDYNQQFTEKQFLNQLQICSICTENIPGRNCIRLHRCGHFYCRVCLNDYIQMTLNNGRFGEKLHCPDNECKQGLLPTEVRQALQNDQLYDRYERITLQNTLASMKDITWCPKCQAAVLIDNPESNLGICYQCHYTFCPKCQKIYHFQAMCPGNFRTEQLKLQQEKERRRMERKRDEALAKLAKMKEERKFLEERALLKEKYRSIIIKLSEQDELLEEVLSAKRIDLLNTRRCPRCGVQIEKNGGCSHMHCSQCDCDFTWRRTEKPANPGAIALLDDNDTNLESAKKQLYEAASTVELSSPTTADLTDQKDDVAISIDNRSILGSSIVKRVQRCPSKSCEKLHIKIDKDNWIVCNGCLKQFCFLCGERLHAANHFEGENCQRYTPI